MSEEKIYLIKNDHGEYLTVERTATWWNSPVGTTVRNIDVALAWAEKYGGHVVTLVEEPEKVVLTKEQAEIVEGAHDFEFPASYISRCNEDEELLMNAYVNGYTLAKDKRYLVELGGLVTTDGAKQYLTKKDGKWFACRRMSGMHQDFTEEELNEAPEWARKLNREEVTDDEQ